MNAKNHRRNSGITLIEAMLAITVLVIAVMGASGYRYYSALDTKRAEMRSTASRIGMLLCESWRGVKGDAAFDPTAYAGADLTMTTMTLPVELQYSDYTSLGAYEIQTEDVSYYTALSYKDVSSGLRALNIVVTWAQRQESQSAFADADKQFSLTTYTELPVGG